MSRPLEHKRKQSCSSWFVVRQLLDVSLEFDITVLETLEKPRSPGNFCWWTARRNTTRLNDAERWWIAYARALRWPLTNICDGGEGAPGRRMSAETRAKIGARNKIQMSRPQMKEAARRSFRAKVNTPEAIARMAASKRNQVVPTDVRLKISNKMKGRPKSEETKRRMSEAKKNQSPETRAKNSAAQKGRKKTPEHIARSVAAKREKWLSRQTK